jgi:hypothetical protein
MTSPSLSKNSTNVGSSSCEIWTNFCIDGNAKQTYVVPEGKEVTVQNLTDKLMIKDWPSWEKLPSEPTHQDNLHQRFKERMWFQIQATKDQGLRAPAGAQRKRNSKTQGQEAPVHLWS